MSWASPWPGKGSITVAVGHTSWGFLISCSSPLHSHFSATEQPQNSLWPHVRNVGFSLPSRSSFLLLQEQAQSLNPQKRKYFVLLWMGSQASCLSPSQNSPADWWPLASYHKHLSQAWVTIMCLNICVLFHMCTKAFVCFSWMQISASTSQARWDAHTRAASRMCKRWLRQIGAVCLEQAGNRDAWGLCRAPGKLPRFAGLSFIYNLTGPGERAVHSWQGHVGIGGAEEERMTVWGHVGRGLIIHSKTGQER